MREIGAGYKTLILLLLVLAVMSSAIEVVNIKHQTRTAFVELQGLYKLRDEMEENWGRLQLEQAAWSTHGRVEQIARNRLDMTIPADDSIKIIRP